MSQISDTPGQPDPFPPAPISAQPAVAALAGLSQLPSHESRQQLIEEGGPFLVGQWIDALLVHYTLAPDLIQPITPFELDLWHDWAWVSLVILTMSRPHPAAGGQISRWLSAPLPDHSFLAVRTYVRHRGQAGVFFLAGWLPSRLSMLLGPRSFGLPSQLARIRLRHDSSSPTLEGLIEPADASSGRLAYQAQRPTSPPVVSQAGSLDEFLMERYVAFTCERSTRRLFRIWHRPWAYAPLSITWQETNLLSGLGPWFSQAHQAGAVHSPGVGEVWVGRPRCVEGLFTDRNWPEVQA